MATKASRMCALFILIVLLASACAQPSPVPTATSQPTQVQPTVDPLYQSQGGGDPRTVAYWMLWNSCAEDNRADTAAANGGRDAGWILLDDLLLDPGVQIGKLYLATCEQGLALLEETDLSGQDQSEDAAYVLASQLLAAQLNLAVGSEYCTAIEQTVQSSQLLLYSLDFDGTSTYLNSEHKDRKIAEDLTDLLVSYNLGELCQ